VQDVFWERPSVRTSLVTVLTPYSISLAGESLQVVAKDFGILQEELEDVIRTTSRRAA
jgi:hypothetical protein